MCSSSYYYIDVLTDKKGKMAKVLCISYLAHFFLIYRLGFLIYRLVTVTYRLGKSLMKVVSPALELWKFP